MKLKSILTTALCGMLALAPCADAFAKGKGKGPPSKGSVSHGKKSSKGSVSHGKKPSKGSGPKQVASRPSSGPRTSGPSRVVHSGGSSRSKPQASIARSGPSPGTRHASPRDYDSRRHAPNVVTRHRSPYLGVTWPYWTLPYTSRWVMPISDYGVSAADVQRALAERGYYHGYIDGIVGPMTRSAIANFQADAGLTVTGTINTSLVHALGV